MLPTFRTRFVPSTADDFYGSNLLRNFFDFETGISSPAVNIVEEKEEYRIEVAAPGLQKDDFKVDLHNNLLTVSCEKEIKNAEENSKYTRREFCYSSFQRTFTLPNTVESEKINASYENGVLQISIPKKDEAKEKPARTIKIA